MQKFLLGDVVSLKSNSPDLTVIAVIESGAHYNVAWFDGVHDHQATYPAEALELSSERNERFKREAEVQQRAKDRTWQAIKDRTWQAI